MKKNSTYRMEEEQLEQLEQLIEYYQNELKQAGYNVQLSKANIVERIIKEKYEQLIEEGKIKS
jgi:hypothetical protein